MWICVAAAENKRFLYENEAPSARNGQNEQSNRTKTVIQDDLLKGIRPLEIELPENEMKCGQVD